MTMRTLTAAILSIATVASPAVAQDRETLGWGRLLTNDWLGDGQDRWRTSSYTLSLVRGPEWDGALPDGFGDLLEYRARVEIIAPRDLSGAGSNDRAYASSVSLGLHTHFDRSGWETSVGADVVALGPQTGLDSLQGWFHEEIGEPTLGANVIANQIADAFYLHGTGEIAYPIDISPTVAFRPFAEAQIGVEDLVRVGADIMIGELHNGSLSVRDQVTGQLYRPITNDAYGWGFVGGADIAYVDDSIYFPASFGTVAQDTRYRGRLGLHWQGGKGVSFFYGMTYLSEEYVGQSEGQFLGSVKLNFNF